jgi:hypothetical protein
MVGLGGDPLERAQRTGNEQEHGSLLKTRVAGMESEKCGRTPGGVTGRVKKGHFR